MPTAPLHKRQIIDLHIDGLAFGARGVGRKDGFVCFVDGAVPGQRVKAEILKVRDRFADARLAEVSEPSPDQVSPPCPYFGVCGGCRLQNLAYGKQVEWKTRQVREILARIGGFPEDVVRPAVPAPAEYGYRNKMEFTFGSRPWLLEKDKEAPPPFYALGLHVPGKFDRVLDIDACLLQSEKANRLYFDAKRRILGTGLPAYGPKTHAGVWRFLIVREGKNTGGLLLHVITSGQDAEKTRSALDTAAEELGKAHPDLTTVVHGMTDRMSQVAFADGERILRGGGTITESIGNRTFEISASSFFQTNTQQAERLFQAVADLARLDGGETVYDLYCGTGTIGIFLADRARRVLGVESVEAAVRNARRNAELNGCSNVEFVRRDMKDALGDPGLTGTHGRPDVVVLDPPRGGTHPHTVRDLIRLAAPKIVYVSCNPPILAKDAKTLCENGYALETVQPVDLFPHTAHVEAVAVLIRRSGS